MKPVNNSSNVRSVAGQKNFTKATPKGSFAFYVEERDVWLMWLVYELEFENLQYACGPDVKEIVFMDIATFVGSKSRSAQLTYKAVFDLP